MTAPIIIRDIAGRDLVMGLISKLNLAKPWSVTVERYVKKRSNAQNDFMWVINTAIADETGHTKDEIHKFLTEMFAPPVIKEVLGKTLTEYPTSNMPTDVMAEYLTRILAFAQCDQGILIPIPKEMYL